MRMLALAAAQAACSSSDTPTRDARDAATDTPMQMSDGAATGPDVSSDAPASTSDGALPQADASASLDAPGADGAPDGSGPDAPSDGSAPDAGSYPSNEEVIRFGNTCAPDGRFGFGDGSLLLCDGHKWRYALRADVPDAPAGGYVSRPDWYPPLRTQFGLPPEVCTIALTEAPIAAADVLSVVPNGAMIGGHVTPIDHWYINGSTLALSGEQRAQAAYLPVRAAADGVIIEASSLGSPTSMRVTIKHACEAVTTYMVVNKLDGVLAPYQATVAAGGFATPNISIKAGEVFGMQRDNPLDFSLADGHAWLSGFAHPFAYVSGDAWKPYIADPLPYWPPSIRDAYTAKMQRTEPPRAGRIDWNKPGTAAGNWFASGTFGYCGRASSDFEHATAFIPGGAVPGKNGTSWSHLAFAPHWVQPSVWIASLGTWQDPAGDFKQFAIRTGPPRPDALTANDGIVAYELVDWTIAGAQGETVDYANLPVGYTVTPSDVVQGVLAVAVNANGTLTVEKRPELKKAGDFVGPFTHPETYNR